MSDEEVVRSRTRVVDHWKRLFAILCGFAITVACARAYSCALTGDLIGLSQFLAFIVTILPVFLGMERSLDLRYLQPQSTIPDAARLIADTAVLTITGLFFLALALSIPDHSQEWLVKRIPTLRSAFYWIFGGFLAFDALVLWATRARLEATTPGTGASRSHANLAKLNAAAAVLVFLLGWFQLTGCLGLPLIAIFRTVVDYSLSSHFLYPQDQLAAEKVKA